jgi:hypothetical protein
MLGTTSVNQADRQHKATLIWFVLSLDRTRLFDEPAPSCSHVPVFSFAFGFCLSAITPSRFWTSSIAPEEIEAAQPHQVIAMHDNLTANTNVLVNRLE